MGKIKGSLQLCVTCVAEEQLTFQKQ